MSLARSARLLTLPSLLAAVALAAAAGCGDTAPEPPAGASVAPKRPDAVDPSGLLEGPLDAFGLRLPLRSTIARRTADTVVVEVPFAFEPVSNYLRARLQTDQVDIGPKQTIFNEARLVNGESKRTFHVILVRTAQTARLTVMVNTGPSEPSTNVQSEYSKLFDGGIPNPASIREQMASPRDSPTPPPAIDPVEPR